MEFNEPNIRVGHPPHPIEKKRNGLLSSRILLKAVLFIVIFLLSFHLADFTPGSYSRKQAIQEILSVLERHRTGLAAITKEELAEVIYEEAIRHNHDPKFVMALIYAESEFFNWAVSEKGAKGLMQIMPYVGELIAKELGIEWAGDRTLFNPYLNIRMGIYYLSRLIADFNDLRVALIAYNYGPTYVKGLIERKERIPTQYYRRIIKIYQDI